jgi:Fe-S oxidoreductase
MSSNELQIDPILTTDRCRYCLMCRHICPVAHVTRNEATSPHGWALLIASVRRGLAAWNKETVSILYHCADCGSCRAHCVTDQPLPLAINASRAEVVEQQLAPAIVYDLRDKLRRWSNPYVEVAPEEVTSQGDAVLVVGAVGRHFQTKTVEAAIKLLAVAGVKVVPIAVGRETPYLAHTLGLIEEAYQLGQATLAEIVAVGAKRVFVLSPVDIYTFTTLLSDSLGLTWPKEIELWEVTTFLAEQVQTKQLTFKPADLPDYTFYDPDHTVRVPGRWEAPRQLLAAITPTPPIELFWRKERAAPCGTGGLYFTQPRLSALLAQTRLAEAQECGVKTFITDDPHTLFHLQRQAINGNVAVKSLFELLAEQLGD